MNNKYVLEDVGTHKCHREFQEIPNDKDRDVKSKIYAYYILINDLANEDIKLFESFVVGYLIVTLSNSWKDYKNNMRNKRMQMSLEDIITQFKRKKNKNKDNVKKAKELSSKANMVEE